MWPCARHAAQRCSLWSALTRSMRLQPAPIIGVLLHSHCTAELLRHTPVALQCYEARLEEAPHNAPKCMHCYVRIVV